MYQQESPVLGSSTEDYALTLTEDETHDLRDALSASISTIPRSESDAASRRARLPAWWSRLAKRVMTWKQAKAEALRLVEQAALNRSELHLTEYQNQDRCLADHPTAERWEITI